MVATLIKCHIASDEECFSSLSSYPSPPHCMKMFITYKYCRKWSDCLTCVDILKGGGDHQVQCAILQNWDQNIRLVCYIGLFWPDSGFAAFRTFIPVLFHCNILQLGGWGGKIASCLKLHLFWTLHPFNAMCDYLAAQSCGNLMLMSHLPSHDLTCSSKFGQVWVVTT